MVLTADYMLQNIIILKDLTVEIIFKNTQKYVWEEQSISELWDNFQIQK